MDLRLRVPRPADIPSLEKLLNESFRYPADQSYRVDFAPLFSHQGLDGTRVMVKGERVVASGALYPTLLVRGGEVHRAGIIGAIATDPAFRNAGLATRILNELEDIGRGKQCDVLVLWSDQTDFYRKLGFSPQGRQEVYALSELIEDGLHAKVLRNAKGAAVYGWDLAQVPALYNQHTMRCERSAAYWGEIEKIRTCTRLQWLDPAGKVQAYLGYDRGKDLQGIIHEWGGEADALFNLVCTALAQRPELAWLTHPGLNDPFRRAYQRVNPILSSHLALFKPLTPEKRDYGRFWFWGLDSL